MTLSEKTLTMACYLNQKVVETGINPTVLITGNIVKPTELVLGGTNDAKGAETNFKGFFKEFRYWKTARTEF